MFEIGDKVRIKTKEEIMSLPTTDVSFCSGEMFIELEDDNTLTFVGDMENTHNGVGNIVSDCTKSVYFVNGDGGMWQFHESWLEKVEVQ